MMPFLNDGIKSCRVGSARRGMTLLGKIPAAPKPINLPSQRCNSIGSQLIASLANIFFIYNMNSTVVGWRIKDLSHMWRGMCPFPLHFLEPRN